MAIVVNDIRAICSVLEKNQVQGVRAIGSEAGLKKDKASEIITKVKLSGLTPSEILQKTNADIYDLFSLRTDRKDWILPDFEKVYLFVFGKRNAKGTKQHSVEEAWHQLYLVEIFNFTKPVNPYCTGDELPDKCLSYSSFLRKFNEWVALNRTVNAEECFADPGYASEINIASPAAVCQIDASGDYEFWQLPNGKVVKSVAFAAVLPYSRLTFLWLGPDHKRETWLRFVIALFKFLGGSCACIKSDNESCLIRRSKVGVGANGRPVYSILPNHQVSFVVDQFDAEWFLCDAEKPTWKGLCERMIEAYQIYEGEVLGRSEDCLAVAESYDSINEKLLIDVNAFNNRNLKDRKFSRTAYFEEHERPYLQPLPDYEVKIPQKVSEHTVNVSGFIRFEGNDYYAGVENTTKCVVAALWPNNDVNIHLFPGYKMLKHHVLRPKGPSVLQVKDPADYTPQEKYVARTIDDFTELAKKFPLLTDALIELFKQFLAHSRANNTEKTATLNRVIKRCEQFYDANSAELLLAIQGILHAGCFKNDVVLHVIEDFVGKSPKQTRRSKVQLELAELQAQNNVESPQKGCEDIMNQLICSINNQKRGDA